MTRTPHNVQPEAATVDAQTTPARSISLDRLETVLVWLVALPALVALELLFLAWAIGLL